MADDMSPMRVAFRESLSADLQLEAARTKAAEWSSFFDHEVKKYLQRVNKRRMVLDVDGEQFLVSWKQPEDNPDGFVEVEKV